MTFPRTHPLARLRRLSRAGMAQVRGVPSSPSASPDVPGERRVACPQCGLSFVPRAGRRITCSAGCRTAFVSDWGSEIDDAECVERMGR